MERIINLIIKLILKIYSGKANHQKKLESILLKVLSNMNYRCSGSIQASGEMILLKRLKKTLKNEIVVIFDVGANIGNYTKELYQLFDNSIIYSFEPSKTTFKILNDNIPTSIRLKIFNLGLSDTPMTASLYSDKDGSGLASLYKRKLIHFNILLEKNEVIELTTIDDFCSKNKIESIYFLKIDVEGNELNVLKGANKMLMNNKIKYIQFEFGGCNIDSRTYFQDFWYLLKNQYNIYRILKNDISLISEYQEYYELFLNSNFFAELKNK